MSKTLAGVHTSLQGVQTLVILLVGQAMATMDGSIFAVAAPSLQANLGASDAELQLVVATYVIAFGSLVVTGARLGDVLGRRRAFLIGLAGFTLASLAGGLAPTAPALILARVAQGAAGALMTPQVLSTIQQQFEGDTRARAIGAYSLILAVGVAAGQVLGGLTVGAHLVAAAWRPALLINVPIGAALLGAARRRLPAIPVTRRQRLDLPGAAVLSTALLALVFPLTFGREAGWPAWVWPWLGACALALAAFPALERRVAARGADPLFDLQLLRNPTIAAGVAAVALVMGCYAGFLITLTLHLQDGLGFGPLHAGATFAVYACGFAAASLTWTRADKSVRDRLPVLGPLAMAAALLGVGLVAASGGWPLAPTSALLLAGGAGHGCAFSPLAAPLTTVVTPGQVAHLSGRVKTASLVGNVIGVASFSGVYLGAAPNGSAHPLALTTAVIAPALVVTTGCALRALTPLGAGRAPKPSRAGS
jgi:predicted MFS family arabinose efflux permease